jgi:hypothetical protein
MALPLFYFEHLLSIRNRGTVQKMVLSNKSVKTGGHPVISSIPVLVALVGLG